MGLRSAPRRAAATTRKPRARGKRPGSGSPTTRGPPTHDTTRWCPHHLRGGSRPVLRQADRPARPARHGAACLPHFYARPPSHAPHAPACSSATPGGPAGGAEAVVERGLPTTASLPCSPRAPIPRARRRAGAERGAERWPPRGNIADGEAAVGCRARGRFWSRADWKARGGCGTINIRGQAVSGWSVCFRGLVVRVGTGVVACVEGGLYIHMFFCAARAGKGVGLAMAVQRSVARSLGVGGARKQGGCAPGHQNIVGAPPLSPHMSDEAWCPPPHLSAGSRETNEAAPALLATQHAKGRLQSGPAWAATVRCRHTTPGSTHAPPFSFRIRRRD